MDDLRYRSGFHHTNDFNKNLVVPTTPIPTTSKGKSLKKSNKNKQENENNGNLFKSKSFVWTSKKENAHAEKQENKSSTNTTITNSNLENLKQKYVQSNSQTPPPPAQQQQQQQQQKESSLPLNLTSEFITQNPLLPQKLQPQQSQPLPNKINILSPIVLPNVSLECESEKKTESQNKGIFVKELNADNYAVLSAQWHQSKNNVNKNDKINNFQQKMQERYAKSRSKDPSFDNCEYIIILFLSGCLSLSLSLSLILSLSMCSI
jgi:hypothetical protein